MVLNLLITVNLFSLRNFISKHKIAFSINIFYIKLEKLIKNINLQNLYNIQKWNSFDDKQRGDFSVNKIWKTFSNLYWRHILLFRTESYYNSAFKFPHILLSWYHKKLLYILSSQKSYVTVDSHVNGKILSEWHLYLGTGQCYLILKSSQLIQINTLLLDTASNWFLVCFFLCIAAISW